MSVDVMPIDLDTEEDAEVESFVSLAVYFGYRHGIAQKVRNRL